MNQSRLLLINTIVVLSFSAQVFAQTDTTPPTLTALALGASSIDVSGAAQSLSITASVTDDLSGVQQIYLTFQSPSNQFVDGLLSRTGGTALNGTYSGSAPFPRFVENGIWHITANLRDSAGNGSALQSSTLATLGFPSQLTVIDTNPDTTPPVVTAITLSPANVDVSAGPQSITVQLAVTDSQTGAVFSNSNVTTFAVQLTPVAGGPSVYFSTHEFKLISGTGQSGVWQASKNLPQYSPSGQWQVSRLVMYDAVTNQVTLSAAQLASMGIAPRIAVVSAPSDSTGPVLHGLSFSPSVIDTSASAQNVTITLNGSDNISGIDFSPETPDIAFIDIEFRSPSTGQISFVSPFTPASPVAGTPLAGTYIFTSSLAQFSEQGTWALSFFRLKDKVGNITSYTVPQLQGMGLPTSIVVTKPSLSPDGNVGVNGGTVNDTAFGSRASVTFPSGVASGPTSVSIDVFPSPLAVPTPLGFTMPGTFFMNLVFSPALPSPLPSPGISVTIPLITPMAPGALLSLYHIDPVLGLSPALNAAHNPVIGSVDPSGISATFNNVVTLSTVVAFISTGSTLGDVNGDGSVNCVDVSMVKSGFGKHTGQAGYNSAADLNSDGVIDIRDLFIVNRQLPLGSACR